MKIIQIGFNKCGTNSIHEYFLANGVPSVHWDEGRLALRMFSNLANGVPLLTGYEHFNVFTDMEFHDCFGVYLEAYKLFPYLAAQYPDAVFILNTRDREKWIESRLNHRRSYIQDHMRHYGATTKEELADRWRCEWDQHHARAIDFFSQSSCRFFVCRIDTDLPHLLSDKLPEIGFDETLFKRHRVTADMELNRKPKSMRKVLRGIIRNRVRSLVAATGP